jgi:hypothetical protein
MEAHRPNETDPPLTLVVFDALMVRGEVLTHKPLLARKHALRGLLPAGSIEAAGLGVVVREAEWQQSNPAVACELVKRGHEGVVVKHRDSRYLGGARNGGWYKWKPGAEIEATCVGFTAGQGRHDGLVGAIRFRLQNGYEGAASGMSDAERREMTEHPERYVGKVIELSYQTLTTDGALRHPQYRRLRDPAEKPAPNLPPTGDVRHDNATAGARSAPAGPPPAPLPRQRNYHAMGDAKLLRSLEQLQAGAGHDAYDRCVSRGSGDVAADIAVCQRLISERGL